MTVLTQRMRGTRTPQLRTNDDSHLPHGDGRVPPTCSEATRSPWAGRHSPLSGRPAGREETCRWHGSYSPSHRNLQRLARSRPLTHPPGGARSAEPRCRSVPTSPPANWLHNANSSTPGKPVASLARRRATARRRGCVSMLRIPASNNRLAHSATSPATAHRLGTVLSPPSPSCQPNFPSVPK